jgi:hypothetical protein
MGLRFADFENFRSADRASTGGCWLAILHRGRGRVFNFSLSLALYAIRLHNNDSLLLLLRQFVLFVPLNLRRVTHCAQ